MKKATNNVADKILNLYVCVILNRTACSYETLAMQERLFEL